MCNLIFWMSVVLLDSNLILCRGDWRLFLREYVLFDGMDVFLKILPVQMHVLYMAKVYKSVGFGDVCTPPRWRKVFTAVA